MATVMEFKSPPEEFPLGSVFDTLPKVTVELERLIPHDTMIIPYLWVRGSKSRDIESAFDSHSGLHDIELIDSVEQEYLLRAEWDREYVGILSAAADFDIVVLSGGGTSDSWRFEVRGETHSSVGEFHTYCREQDISIQITSVHDILSVEETEYKLTDNQREALLLAFEFGYFETPRKSRLEDIANELDITQQSLSSRLRRGYRRLIAGTLKSE